jgi:putative ABC transport system substrate-binding protein
VPATPPAIYAAKAASSNIPIVFPLGSDPVETGLVSDLERPGGNVPGMATMSRLQSQPRLALVRECMSTARRVALIRPSANAALEHQVDASREAAPEHEFEILVLEFAIAEEIEQSIQDCRRTKSRSPIASVRSNGPRQRREDCSSLAPDTCPGLPRPTPW